jgi:hypothetical protein
MRQRQRRRKLSKNSWLRQRIAGVSVAAIPRPWLQGKIPSWVRKPKYRFSRRLVCAKAASGSERGHSRLVLNVTPSSLDSRFAAPLFRARANGEFLAWAATAGGKRVHVAATQTLSCRNLFCLRPGWAGGTNHSPRKNNETQDQDSKDNLPSHLCPPPAVERRRTSASNLYSTTRFLLWILSWSCSPCKKALTHSKGELHRRGNAVWDAMRGRRLVLRRGHDPAAIRAERSAPH